MEETPRFPSSGIHPIVARYLESLLPVRRRELLERGAGNAPIHFR
jgi:hypothetical protein